MTNKRLKIAKRDVKFATAPCRRAPYANTICQPRVHRSTLTVKKINKDFTASHFIHKHRKNMKFEPPSPTPT